MCAQGVYNSRVLPTEEEKSDKDDNKEGMGGISGHESLSSQTCPAEEEEEGEEKEGNGEERKVCVDVGVDEESAPTQRADEQREKQEQEQEAHIMQLLTAGMATPTAATITTQPPPHTLPALKHASLYKAGCYGDSDRDRDRDMDGNRNRCSLNINTIGGGKESPFNHYDMVRQRLRQQGQQGQQMQQVWPSTGQGGGGRNAVSSSQLATIDYSRRTSSSAGTGRRPGRGGNSSISSSRAKQARYSSNKVLPALELELGWHTDADADADADRRARRDRNAPLSSSSSSALSVYSRDQDSIGLLRL